MAKKSMIVFITTFFFENGQKAFDGFHNHVYWENGNLAVDGFHRDVFYDNKKKAYVYK